MSPHARIAAPAGAGVPAWHAHRLQADWSAVRIHLVEVVPYAHGGRVRAVVRLGALAPADVHVELRPADAGAAPRAPGRPMWSAQSYDNGCYVFETTLAGADVAAAGEWLVRVRPREALPAADVQQRLRLDASHVTPS